MEKNQNQNQKKHKKRSRTRLKVILISQIILLTLILGALALYFFGGYAKKINQLKADADSLVSNSTIDTFRASQTSVVYDVNGKEITVVKGEKDSYYLTFDQIPEGVKGAIISIEDKKFYKHRGVDFKAIVRAAVAMIKNQKITQGGSTITQQLARTVFLSNEKSWERKVEEIFIAVGLERKYSKEQILEFYLNNIYFANGYYGIEAAARGYFNKGVAELSLADQAMLCGSRTIRPFTTRWKIRTMRSQGGIVSSSRCMRMARFYRILMMNKRSRSSNSTARSAKNMIM